MKTPRPRPVPPGTASPKMAGQPQGRPNGSLRSGASEAMRELAMRRAAQKTDFSYKAGDTSSSPPPPFAGFGWEEAHSDDVNTAPSEGQGEFFPR